MKNFLKYTVIILGLLIIILFIVLVVGISDKYNKNLISNQNLELKPLIKINEKIKAFHIEDEKVYIFIEIENDNTQLLLVHDLKTGVRIKRVKLK